VEDADGDTAKEPGTRNSNDYPRVEQEGPGKRTDNQQQAAGRDDEKKKETETTA